MNLIKLTSLTISTLLLITLIFLSIHTYIQRKRELRIAKQYPIIQTKQDLEHFFAQINKKKTSVNHIEPKVKNVPSLAALSATIEEQ